MAKVALICLYDNAALGIRNLSNALIENGHSVSVIHFKLPIQKKLDDFLRYPMLYENVHSNQSDRLDRYEFVLSGYNIDVNMWTHNEIHLLGDVLTRLMPDIVGISTRSVYGDYIDTILKQIKVVGKALTIAGGFGASFDPDYYLRYLDYVCIGEGESTIVQLADSVDNGTDPRLSDNLVYKDNGKLIYNKLSKPDESLDYFFSPKFDSVEHIGIEHNTTFQMDPLLTMAIVKVPFYQNLYYTMIGKGCIGNCSFCAAGKFHNLYRMNNIILSKRRVRPIPSIIQELKIATARGNFKKIFFMDSFFVGPKKYLIDFFNAYEREIHVPFFAQLHPRQVMSNPEILSLACRAGLSHTVVGIQSGSESVRKAIFNRNEPNSVILEFSKLLSSFPSLSIDYHLLTHNPLEDDTAFEETLSLIAMLPKKNAQLVLNRLRPFPGTEMYELLKSAARPNISVNQHQRFWLSLFRYFLDDKGFETLRKRCVGFNFGQMKELFEYIRNRNRPDKES